MRLLSAFASKFPFWQHPGSKPFEYRLRRLLKILHVSTAIPNAVSLIARAPFSQIFSDTNDVAVFENLYDLVHSGNSFFLPASIFGIRSDAGRHWIHDLHDLSAAGKLLADRASRRTTRIHTVQCCGPFGRP